MPCLRVHIEDATGAAGLRRRAQVKVWPYILAIGYAAGVLSGIVLTEHSPCEHTIVKERGQ